MYIKRPINKPRWFGITGQGGTGGTGEYVPIIGREITADASWDIMPPWEHGATIDGVCEVDNNRHYILWSSHVVNKTWFTVGEVVDGVCSFIAYFQSPLMYKIHYCLAYIHDVLYFVVGTGVGAQYGTEIYTIKPNSITPLCYVGDSQYVGALGKFSIREIVYGDGKRSNYDMMSIYGFALGCRLSVGGSISTHYFTSGKFPALIMSVLDDEVILKSFIPTTSSANPESTTIYSKTTLPGNEVMPHCTATGLTHGKLDGKSGLIDAMLGEVIEEGITGGSVHKNGLYLRRGNKWFFHYNNGTEVAVDDIQVNAMLYYYQFPYTVNNNKLIRISG